MLRWPVHYDGTPSTLRRLSRDELVETFRVLTGATPSREALPEDQRPGLGLLLNAGASFIEAEIGKLDQVVTAFAAQVAPSLLATSACSQAGQAQRDCLSTWASGFGERALRRPLTAAEKTVLAAIVAPATGVRGEDVVALQGVLRAFFLAPSFLYRTELGSPGSSGDVRALTARELAVRLAYLATVGPPDAELLRDAAALSDPAARVQHLDRLAATPAGKRARALLVLEWLLANESKVAQKAASYLEGLGDGFDVAIRASAEAAIGKVLDAEPDASPASLLTSVAYLGDAAVRKVTVAQAGTGDDAATRRAGLLLHPYVLAAHTKENGASPFQLGAYLREALLCETVAQPPPDAVDSATAEVPPGASMRESFELRTQGAVCQGCHRQFAPLGFAFLPFDPVGRWMKQDPSGKPWKLDGRVDTSSDVALQFDSPAALVEAIGRHTQAQGCFAQAAITWALGRRPVEQDGALLVEVDAAVGRSGGGVTSVLRAIVASPSFTTSVAGR